MFNLDTCKFIKLTSTLVGLLENACTDTRTGAHGHSDTDTYGKDEQLWKRRTVMEKTDRFGKDGQLWKRQTAMEKTDTKRLKPIF